jgi:hypothetical protein
MILQASAEDIERCYEFAQAQYKTSSGMYAQRGQTDKVAIIRQIAQGKIAELMVYKYLKQQFSVREPDFQIYTGRRKSYEADLTDGFLRFHIKAQDYESARRYGVSWVFTPKDPLLTEPAAEDILVLVLLKNDTVKIMGFLSALTAQEKGLYADPKLKRLKGLKAVLYLKTITKHTVDEL